MDYKTDYDLKSFIEYFHGPLEGVHLRVVEDFEKGMTLKEIKEKNYNEDIR